MSTITLQRERVVELPDRDQWAAHAASGKAFLTITAFNEEKFLFAWNRATHTSSYHAPLGLIADYVPYGNAQEVIDHFGERAELLEEGLQTLALSTIRTFDPTTIAANSTRQAELAMRAIACRALSRTLTDKL